MALQALLSRVDQNSIIESRSDSNTVITSKELQIDTCPITQQLESEFLTEDSPKPYRISLNDDTANTSSVVKSRALATEYIWPKDKPLTIARLKKFETNGHTLGIDNTKTYFRMFALDLDCPCRCSQGLQLEHLNEALVLAVQNELKSIFLAMFQINDARFSIWRNDCGFHIYTDIPVSLPTHLFIKKQLESSQRLLNMPVIIEVPSIMPLPFSAKKTGKPYTLVTSDNDFDHIPLTICTEVKGCLEYFRYQSLFLEGRTVAKIDSILGESYLVKLPSCIQRMQFPRFVNGMSISIFPEFNYMSQVHDFITTSMMLYNEQITTLADVSLEEFNENERMQIRLFMSEVNKRFDRYGNDSCEAFIKVSALDYGGLYLQPLVAALYLAIENIKFDRFKILLKCIYQSVMNQYDSIKRFVDLVNLETVKAYNDETSISILDHLHFLVKYNVDPKQTIDEKINTIMEDLTDSKAEVILSEIQKRLKKEKEVAKVIIEDLLDKFKMIFLEMRLFYYNINYGRYYYLNFTHGAKYESSDNFRDNLCPEVVRNWIGKSQVANTCLKLAMENSNDMKISEDIKFTTNEFMISTKVGVFNSAVGLYTAQTRFLRFDKYRNVVLWPFKEQPKIYHGQNEAILNEYKSTQRFISIIREDLLSLYTHSVIAPALIQMRKVMSVEERAIEQFFSILSHYNKYDSLLFIVDYYQFDPKIVYLITHICNEYGGLDAFYSYDTLCSKIFCSESASAFLWSDKFQSVVNSAKYTVNASSYMDKLLSLNGPHVDSVDQVTYLMVVLILAFVVKCDTYNELVNAFNIKLPEIIDEHPSYCDFEYSVSMQTMKTNFIRAREIVFGKNLSNFELLLADQCFSLCMSTNFIPETTINLLTAISAVFLATNVCKKFFLFQGAANSGKSLLCSIIQEMLSPSIGRFLDVSQVMSRSSVSDYYGVIINEAYQFHPAELKTMTGNDSVSMTRFYSQKYELRHSQTIVYGATNTYVKFKGSEDVDKTTISRLFAIHLTGKQCAAGSKFDSFISMMIDGYYFSGIFSLLTTESSAALNWLAYCLYEQTRDINLHPSLNTESGACREYQNTVHYKNSKLYKFIIDCGLIDAPQFQISKHRFVDIVKRNLDKSNYLSFESFKTPFEAQYNVSLNKHTTISNFQQIGFIQHVIDNFAITEEEGSVITHEDLKKRAEIYSHSEHKSNAMAYFRRTNQIYYDYNTGVYKGITFAIDSGETYEGNEWVSSSSNLSVNQNSLVFKSV